MVKATTKKSSIFNNVKKDSDKKPRGLSVVECSESLAAVVDRFCKLHDEITARENEQTQDKETILESGLDVLAQRYLQGQTGNIKLQGIDRLVSVTMQSSGRGLTQSDVDVMVERFGDKAESLVVKDEGAIKLNGSYLAENPRIKEKFDRLMVENFSATELSEMFAAVPYKTVDDVVEKSAALVNDPEDLVDLWAALKITKSVKVS